MKKRTRSLLEELSSMPLKRDKEEVVESRASHILESAIRLMTYIRENFDSETAYKLEKKFNSAIKNMDASKFSKGVARIKENQDIKNNVLKIKDGEYKED
jgi:hypothetical protein|tara:strand:- start:607 stop:906 length:300 start_codon:yes stop_codon:yes gene_type:complete